MKEYMDEQKKMLQQAMKDFERINAEIVTLRRKSEFGNWWEAEIIFDGRKMLFSYNSAYPDPSWFFVKDL